MPDYEKMYLRLFNAITDALTELGENNYGNVADVLRKAQTDVEEYYIAKENQKY